MARSATAHGTSRAGGPTAGSRDGPRRSRAVLGVATGLAVPTAIVVGLGTGRAAAALSLVALAAVVGWRAVPGFWRTVGRAALGGAGAGLLVLGPGYRLAMRVVALLDPTMPTELTLAGTLFIVLGVGGLAGAVTTAWVAVVARSLQLGRSAGTTLLALATGVQLLGGPDVRAEIAELGGGPWVNLALFGGVTVAFASLADRWARPTPREVAAPPTPPAPPATAAPGRGRMVDGRQGRTT